MEPHTYSESSPTDLVTELSKLSHEDPKGNDYFGEQVAISGDIIAVAAPKDDILASGSNRQDAGSVSLFKVDSATTSPGLQFYQHQIQIQVDSLAVLLP